MCVVLENNGFAIDFLEVFFFFISTPMDKAVIIDLTLCGFRTYVNLINIRSMKVPEDRKRSKIIGSIKPFFKNKNSFQYVV